MRGSSRRRPGQGAELIRQGLAEALTRDVRDPRIGLVTLSRIAVSGDLSHATVFLMVPGDEAERERALEGLRSAAGFLRTRVAKALSTRLTPELHFELDRGMEHAARVSARRAELRREGGD